MKKLLLVGALICTGSQTIKSASSSSPEEIYNTMKSEYEKYPDAYVLTGVIEPGDLLPYHSTGSDDKGNPVSEKNFQKQLTAYTATQLVKWGFSNENANIIKGPTKIAYAQKVRANIENAFRVLFNTTTRQEYIKAVKAGSKPNAIISTLVKTLPSDAPELVRLREEAVTYAKTTVGRSGKAAEEIKQAKAERAGGANKPSSPTETARPATPPSPSSSRSRPSSSSSSASVNPADLQILHNNLLAISAAKKGSLSPALKPATRRNSRDENINTALQKEALKRARAGRSNNQDVNDDEWGQ